MDATRADSSWHRIEELALARGVDCFGVADLTPARAFVEAQGGAIVGKYPRAICIGIHLFDDLVEMVTPTTRSEISPYGQHIYEVVSPRLDVIALELAQALRRSGFAALPVPHLLSGKNTAIFSYKLAAHLAGLGWIGKSCLLVTPEHGPRVRFSAVLTDAPLPAGRPIEDRCGACTRCIDACPVNAFTGRPFRADEPREARFDAQRCERFRGTDRKVGDPAARERSATFACGVCVQVCPFGEPTAAPRPVIGGEGSGVPA